MSNQLAELKLKKIKMMEEKLRLKEGLPFLHRKRYGWQQDYIDAKYNKKRLICAANQIGKSTIQIDDDILIATHPELWPKMWPNIFKSNPNMKPFTWYLYPNMDTVMSEFETKWMTSNLPIGDFCNHAQYGWKYHKSNKVLKYLEFNTGYRIYFKTYNQNVHDLQSGTVFKVSCDEELPEDLLPELQARLFATDGYFSMAFTATIGQDFWRDVVEGKGEEERWPDAWKRQVSMYDCLKYHDGSNTSWTRDRIKMAISNCKNENEVKRRIYGRFVKDSGLKYPGFTRENNYVPYPKDKNGNYYKGVPRGWSVYSAVDIGSGGDNHPAAYSFLAVSPDYDKIRWFKGRRLDGIETTAADIFTKYLETKGKISVSTQVYDWASKDFGTIAGRAGESFKKAQKEHTLGEQALNSAFKSGIFKIYYDPSDPNDESMKLVRELESLSENTNKRNAKDDFIDTCRYAIVEIPIDWDKVINGDPIKEEPTVIEGSKEQRRPRDYIWASQREEDEDNDECIEEIGFWDDLY